MVIVTDTLAAGRSRSRKMALTSSLKMWLPLLGLLLALWLPSGTEAQDIYCGDKNCYEGKTKY